MDRKGLVFNIQRYSVHDGNGIRTIIFLKGCPLSCPWCANPESRKEVKPITWIKNGCLETVGEWRTITDIVDEVMKDEIFFRTSGGGITISGGEVLMQAEFAKELLEQFNDLGIHTAIETTGCFPVERIRMLSPFLNQVLFDLKIMDLSLAKRVIGIDVNTVKENFEYLLSKSEIELVPRVPLIPGYTIMQENLRAIAYYLNSLSVSRVHLLPFHQYGSKKYEYLGWKYKMEDISTLKSEELEKCRKIFESENIKVNIEGL